MTILPILSKPATGPRLIKAKPAPAAQNRAGLDHARHGLGYAPGGAGKVRMRPSR
jgi:hypothetical protein